MPENQTRPTKASVSTFLESVEDPARRADAKAVAKMMKTATGEKAVMWGPAIVGFGSVHYKYQSGREGDMPMIGFSPRKSGLVLYGTNGGGEVETLRARLGKHTTGKSCLYIKKLSDVDQGVLTKMIEKSVAAKRKGS